MKRDTLYLGAWDFNKCVICDKIEFLVEKAGGTLHGYYRPGMIYRRYKNKIGESRQTNNCDWADSLVIFSLDGTYYTLSFPDNPFFKFHYQKIKLNDNGKIVGEYYAEDFTKSWLVDALFSHNATEKELTDAAEIILNALVNAKYSERVTHKKRKTVSNIYDGGTHYEWVDATDKTERIPSERKKCYW